MSSYRKGESKNELYATHSLETMCDTLQGLKYSRRTMSSKLAYLMAWMLLQFQAEYHTTLRTSFSANI